MECNKENINRSPPKSRIPVLVRPLSTQPKRKLESKANRNLIRSDSKTQREPLKMIDHHNIHTAGPSYATKASKLNQFQWHIDTRYVTFRQKNHAGPEVDKKNDIMTTSDDKVSEENVIKWNIANNIHCDILCEVDTVATPTILKSVGENLRVKNIKKSLKRPHSRELQGISHQGKQDRNNNEKIKMRYKELLKDRLESPDFINRSYMTCLAENYVSDLYKYLLEVERKPLDSPNIKNVTRSCLINWLVKINGINQPDTVQTACWYLDSILGTRLVEVHNLQVVAAACYWIAQKLHGTFMIASNLVKCSNRAFTCSKLLAAERAVLMRLNFPPQPVIPQDFINYLAWWCDNEHPGDIELAATFLCMSGLMVDKSLCLDYPSVIAAASVRNALLLYKGKHLMKQLMTCPLYQSAESKAAYFGRTCSILRRAVRTVASQDYEYKATYEQFGFPPSNIAQKVINAAIKLYESDKKNF